MIELIRKTAAGGRWRSVAVCILLMAGVAGCRDGRPPTKPATPSIHALLQRGFNRYHQGDLDGALAVYNEVIQLDPHEARAYNDRGVIRQDKGDLNGAIADFDAALKINPQLVGTFLSRGIARQDKGDVDGAIADF